jgi:hypothetical protein
MAGSVANARKANTSGANTTTTTSFTSTAGSTIWVGVSDASGQGSLTISDNKGNTYTQIGTTRTSASGAQIRRFYCANIAGGAGHTVTATWGSNSDATVHVLELAGVATASLDSAASAQADDSNPPWTVTSGTLAQADSIAVAMTGTAFAGTWSESSGFTVQTQEGDNNLYWTGCAASRVVAATTALTPSFTISGGGSDCAVAVDVFKASAGGVAYDLTVDPASYSLTAAAETVTATRALTITPASYALTAAAVSLAAGRAVNFAPASYTLSAAAETLTVARALSVDPASYALTAADVTLEVVSANPVLSVDPVSYTLSPSDVTFEFTGGVQLLGGGPGGPVKRRKGGTESYLERLLGRPLDEEPEQEEIEVIEQAAEVAAKAPQPPERDEVAESLRAYGLALKDAYVEIYLELEHKKRQAMEEQEIMAVIAICF